MRPRRTGCRPGSGSSAAGITRRLVRLIPAAGNGRRITSVRSSEESAPGRAAPVASACGGSASSSASLSAARASRTWPSSATASCGRSPGCRAVALATRSSSRGESRNGGGRRGHAFVEVLVEDLCGGVAAVRFGAGQHLVQHHAAGVDVRPGVGRALLDLLGGQVGDGAQDGARAVRLGVHGPDEAEVGDLDPAVVPDQHVLRLHVAVDESGPVRGAECGEDRLQDVQGRTGAQRAPLAQDVAQRAPGDVLHRQIDVRALRALVEHADHIGVVEPCDGLGLPDEPLHERGVDRQCGVHHLEGDHPVQTGVDGPVDRGHATDGDARVHPVAAVEQLPDERGLRVTKRRIHAGECTSRR